MTLKEYRAQCDRIHERGWDEDIDFISEFLSRMPIDLNILRGFTMYTCYSSLLVKGASFLEEPYSLLNQIFKDQCESVPASITAGEITLGSLANLFACIGKPDYTRLFVDRLYDVKTDQHGEFAQWHHAKTLAGIALGERGLYRAPVAAEVELDELMPFVPGELHGPNPQSLLAHLAGAVENQAAIEDVWPAFEEFMLGFPVHEEVGVFDGPCMVWIARIVHHQIGGQPLGQTAAWLYRHFNAWADGAPLPPLAR